MKPTVVIAPNAFKHALSATAAAEALARGWEKSRSAQIKPTLFPIADGGDGTASLLMQYLQAASQKSRVLDPLGRALDTDFGWIEKDKTAIIEMANASGIRLLTTAELNPLLASSYGTGLQMQQAIAAGAQKIILAMGGSATVDGALGMLSALGLVLLDANGNRLPARLSSMPRVYQVEASAVKQLSQQLEIIILCDVDNPLTGPKGAAAVFGPQKGADTAMVPQLDAWLDQWAAISTALTGRDMRLLKGAGTAGGAAAGLWAWVNAQLVDGIDYFLDITHFDAAMEHACLLITGEGSIDEQTLQGKAPFGVAKRAKEKNLPVIAVAGKIPTTINTALAPWFDALFAIGAGPVSLETAMANTAADLERMGFMLGNTWNGAYPT